MQGFGPFGREACCAAAFPLRSGFVRLLANRWVLYHISDKSQRKKGKKIGENGRMLVILSGIRHRHSAIRPGCGDGEEETVRK
jgi:hypothetical protein